MQVGEVQTKQKRRNGVETNRELALAEAKVIKSATGEKERRMLDLSRAYFGASFAAVLGGNSEAELLHHGKEIHTLDRF